MRNFFDDLKTAVSFEEVARFHGVEFGRDLKSLCPFHDEKTPSFSLHPSRAYAHCFACDVSADAISLEYELGRHGSMFEAAQALNERYHAGLKSNGFDKEKAEELNKALGLLDWFCIQANEILLGDKTTLTWLESTKGITIEDVKTYRIGYIGSMKLRSKQGCLAKFKENRALFHKLGILKEAQGGGSTEAFDNRLIFPVWQRGKIRSIWTRQYPDNGNDQYKWLGPHTSEFIPHKLIAFPENLNCKECLIVEGITDAITLIKTGFPACALLGTDVSQYNQPLFEKAKGRLLFALDPDEPGREAAYKLARRFKGYIMELGDKDPDELLVELGPEQFKAVVEKGIKGVKYYLDAVVEREDRIEALREIAKLRYEGEKDMWLGEIAKKYPDMKPESHQKDLDRIAKEQKGVTPPRNTPPTTTLNKGSNGDKNSSNDTWGGNFRGKLENFFSPLEESPQKTSFDDVLRMAENYLYITPDTKYALKISCASVVANFLDEDPVWLLIVAPPSSAKTEIIQGVSGAPMAWNISSFTSKTLASGEKNNLQASLLTRIGSFGFIFLKDFTTILELNPIERAEIFSQLREIYDGAYYKTFGNGVVIDWKGKIGITGGCTPIIERYGDNFKVLGERFLMCRISDVTTDNQESALNKALLEQSSSIGNLRDDLRTIGGQFLQERLGSALRQNLAINKNEIEIVKSCAKFIAQTRAAVIRDSYRRDDILVKPFQESPMRLGKQLKSLLKGLCLVDNVTTPSDAHFTYLIKISFDNIPSLRKEILAAVPEQGIYQTELARDLGYAENSTHFSRMLEDLTKLNILKKEKIGKRVSVLPADTVNDFYALFDRFRTEIIEENKRTPENTPPTYKTGFLEPDEAEGQNTNGATDSESDFIRSENVIDSDTEPDIKAPWEDA